MLNWQRAPSAHPPPPPYGFISSIRSGGISRHSTLERTLLLFYSIAVVYTSPGTQMDMLRCTRKPVVYLRRRSDQSVAAWHACIIRRY